MKAFISIAKNVVEKLIKKTKKLWIVCSEPIFNSHNKFIGIECPKGQK